MLPIFPPSSHPTVMCFFPVGLSSLKRHFQQVLCPCPSQETEETSTPAGKRALGRPRRRWEDNIRMDLKEIGINTRNWVDLTQDRDYWRALVIAALNLPVS